MSRTGSRIARYSGLAIAGADRPTRRLSAVGVIGYLAYLAGNTIRTAG